MKKQITTLALGLTIAGTTLAATQTTTTDNSAAAANAGAAQASTSVAPVSLRKMLKQQNFGLELASDTTTRKDKSTFEINGFKSINNVLTNFKATKNDVIKTDADFRTIYTQDLKTNETTTDHNFERFTLSYQRKNLLTEAENGVALSTQLDYRVYPEVSVREQNRLDGMARIRLSAGKQFTERYSATFIAYQAAYNRQTGASLNDDGVVEQPDTGYTLLELYQTVGITNKLGITLYTPFLHAYKRQNDADNKDTEETSAQLSLDYAFSRAFSGSVYASADILKSHDGQTMAKNWDKDLAYGVSLFAVAF